jgi:transcriptional regulator with XRE-family HTH domain
MEKNTTKIANLDLGIISKRIEEKRLSMDMNQAEFAKYMDVSQSMVSKWESGSYNFTIKTLREICHRLDLDLNLDINSKEN